MGTVKKRMTVEVQTSDAKVKYDPENWAPVQIRVFSNDWEKAKSETVLAIGYMDKALAGQDIPDHSAPINWAVVFPIFWAILMASGLVFGLGYSLGHRSKPCSGSGPK